MRLFCYGRCRSGRRWFWAAEEVIGEPSAERHGWTDTEDAALAAAASAVDDMGGANARRQYWAATATRRVKEINKAKRASRPASKAKGSATVEYLYACDERPIRYPILRKTARRIYFSGEREPLADDGSSIGHHGYLEDVGRTCFVDRAKLEADTGVWSKSLRERLYMTLEASLSWQIKDKRERIRKADTVAADLPALKQARGGNSAAFIAARKRYVAARRKSAP